MTMHVIVMALTSGLTRPHLSSDLGVGLSTVNKRVQKHLAAGGVRSFKKGDGILRDPKVKRFAFIDTRKEGRPIEFLFKVLHVTSHGYRAWKARPMSQRQRDDMAILAQIREQHRLSAESYGRPRMTEELRELGLNVGHRRMGRLMRESGIGVIRIQKFKVTTDSNLTFNIAPNLLDQDLTAE